MSAQGATIQVGRPVRMPVRLLASVVAVAAAAAIGVAGVRTIAEDDATARPAMHAGPADRGHGASMLRDRSGDAPATAMPVQRLYPDGFGASSDEPTTIRSGARRKW